MAHNRNASSQTNHNNMLSYIVNNLVSNGYSVKADHIGWRNGSPDEINGYRPDIVASKNGASFIFEIETCASYGDDHAKSQLQAFNRVSDATVYIIVPDVCVNHGVNINPVPKVRANLNSWHLTDVQIGTCNPHSGKINYTPES